MPRIKRPLTIIFTLLLLLLTVSPAWAWDDCPKNKVVCDQPCRDFIDTNSNGTCDHIEAAPKSSSAVTVAKTTVSASPNPTATAAPAATAGTSNVTSSTTVKLPVPASGSTNSTSSSTTASAAAASSPGGTSADAASTSSQKDNPTSGENILAAVKQPSFLVTIGLLLGALVVARRRMSSQVRLGVLGVSLASLGFYFQGCMCPVGVLANLPLHLAGLLQGKYMLWLLLFLAPIIFLFWGGRVFCGGVCPIGAVQEFLFRLGRKLGLNKGRPGLEKIGWLRYGKYLALLAVLMVTPVVGSAWWCDIDPFGYLFNLSGTKVALGLLVGVLTVSLFISRFWCRCLCPYGALLGILNKDIMLLKQGLGWGVNGPAIDTGSCRNCGKCARACPVDAIVGCVIDSAECINCGECSRQCKLGAVQLESPGTNPAQPALTNAT